MSTDFPDARLRAPPRVSHLSADKSCHEPFTQPIGVSAPESAGAVNLIIMCIIAWMARARSETKFGLNVLLAVENVLRSNIHFFWSGTDIDMIIFTSERADEQFPLISRGIYRNHMLFGVLVDCFHAQQPL